MQGDTICHTLPAMTVRLVSGPHVCSNRGHTFARCAPLLLESTVHPPPPKKIVYPGV